MRTKIDEEEQRWGEAYLGCLSADLVSFNLTGLAPVTTIDDIVDAPGYMYTHMSMFEIKV